MTTMADDTPDLQLIALIERVAAQSPRPGATDSQAALRELYDLTSGKLYGVAMRVLGNRDWAEDVLQEAFLNIWRIAGDYRCGLSPPMAWMGVIVRSRALDFRAGAPASAPTPRWSWTTCSRYRGRRYPQPHGHHRGQRAGLGAARMPAQARWPNSARWSAWPTCAT
jgi:hypothetical protein